MRFLSHALLIAFALLLAACATPRLDRSSQVVMVTDALPAQVPGAASPDAHDRAYRMGAQDLIDVTVLGVPDLSRTVRVGADGSISLPLIGNIQAGAKTVPELEQAIEAAYGARYLQRPQVTVFVKEYTSQRVTVEGAVVRPGIYSMMGRTTLLQAIASASGIDPLGDTRGVVVFRIINGQRMAAAFDLDAIRTGRSEDPQVYGDDLVVVAQSGSKTALRRFIETVPALGVFAIFRGANSGQ